MKKILLPYLKTAFCILLILTVSFTKTLAAASNKNSLRSEMITDNQWDVLVLIYKDVETENFSNSFTNEDLVDIHTVVEKLPDTMNKLSRGRMQIRSLDIFVIEEPVTSVSDTQWGNLTYGKNGDINFNTYLDAYDYNQIVVFAPLNGYPAKYSWYGLGGTHYRYNKKNIYYCIISDTLYAGEDGVNVYGDTYDIRINTLTHEMLHCVETNSRRNGWSGFEELHNGEENNYDSAGIGWLDWQIDLMRDTIKTGNLGFRPESFLVSHDPKRQPIPVADSAKVSNWAKDEVDAARSANLITESTDSYMTRNITRLQFAELIVNLTEKITGKTIRPAPVDTFTDCTDTDVLKAYAAGIVNGIDINKFAPNTTASREQITVMLARAIDYIETETDKSYTSAAPDTSKYVDWNQVSVWAADDVALLAANGIINGTSDTTLSPKAFCTVEQCVLLIYRFFTMAA